MKEVIVVGALRTAIGKLGGALVNETADLLAASVMNGLLKQTKIDPSIIDEVILGQAKQSADLSNLARYASLRANLPLTIPAYTVHRQCGSGLQALNNAVMQIQSENAEIILCGGVESMSTAPYYVNGVRFGTKSGNVELKDSNTASQAGSQPYDVYGNLTMGLTADNIAARHGISREDQDKYALQSQERAERAIKNGVFKDEIVPYEIKDRKSTVIFEVDEHPRATSLEQLGKLKPVFSKEGTVTAGNASGRNDGAAALLSMSKEKAIELGFNQGIRVVSFASVGVEPNYMGLGPIPATKKALEKANLKIEDIDVIELNEAFAAQVLAFHKAFNLPLESEKVNPNGGAIALGHPIGATGAILVVKLFNEMKRRNLRYGLASLCIAGGLGITTIFERIEF